MKKIGTADKLNRLKAKRNAVVQAIRAIEELGTEYGWKLAPHRSERKFPVKHLSSENGKSARGRII
jgi:hypothetical protein